MLKNILNSFIIIQISTVLFNRSLLSWLQLWYCDGLRTKWRQPGGAGIGPSKPDHVQLVWVPIVVPPLDSS